MAGKRFYPGDRTDLEGIALGAGRDNDDNTPKSVKIVAMAPVEGILPGEATTVGAKRAEWLVMNGYATRYEDYMEAHPDAEVKDHSASDGGSEDGGSEGTP